MHVLCTGILRTPHLVNKVLREFLSLLEPAEDRGKPRDCRLDLYHVIDLVMTGTVHTGGGGGGGGGGGRGGRERERRRNDKESIRKMV